MIELLPLTLALPLAGVIVLALGGRWLSGRAAGWLASALVGLSFLLAVGIGVDYLSGGAGSGATTVDAVDAGPAGEATHDERPAYTQRLWRWMAAGQDLVEVTIAQQPLQPMEPVPAEAVGTGWAPADDPRIAGILPQMWDPQAVVGERPLTGPIPAGQVLLATTDSVPAGQTGFTPATPRYQQRFAVDVALRLDGLSLLMLLIVTGVGFLIHVYSVGYMDGDPGARRYFTYLNLFVFSMLTLVLGAGFLVMFVGWELVGACSYLLIGFWYRDDANADAGRKAFIVNRIGDVAFLLGLMLLWSTFGSLAYADVLPAAGNVLAAAGPLLVMPWGAEVTVAAAIALLLLIGATGKSAQLPLFVWLPDAMAGPTPVSALIHAATMVTAGVYMIARAHAVFEAAPTVMLLVAAVGALTALLAGLIALAQADIKRVLAYSTISQLGYMFMAVGAGAYVAAMFHLMTHAFFKALLFLGAGSVMHAVEHGFEKAGEHPEPRDGVPPEQDMRNMGGLLGRTPATGWTFLVGGLALAGLFPLAGFWSKDEILLETLARGAEGGGAVWTVLWAIGLVTAVLTALYIGRQLLLVLAGAARTRGAEDAVESPATMTGVLVVLALLSVFGGLPGLALGGGESMLASLLEPVVGAHHGAAPISATVMRLIATAAALAGLALAWLWYRPDRSVDPDPLGAAAPRAFGAASAGFGIDAAYHALFVTPFRRTADFLWHVVDDGLIDGAVNGAARLTAALGQGLRRWQTGYVRRYALSMVLGALLIAVYLFMAVR